MQSYILDYVPLTNNCEQANEHEAGVLAALSKKIKFLVFLDMPRCLMEVHRRFGGICLPHPKVYTHNAGGRNL